MNQLWIGVTGYSTSTFDITQALSFLQEAYDSIVKEFPHKEYIVVSGLTNLGVPKLAYEEAVRRGWETAGVACTKAQDFDWYPIDKEPVLIGEEWGDESEYFIDSIDVLVRVGNGPQALREAASAQELGKKVYEYDLPRE